MFLSEYKFNAKTKPSDYVATKTDGILLKLEKIPELPPQLTTATEN
jgi:hypothetical protein